MAPHELDPQAMARLIESSAWQSYLRDFLLPTFARAMDRYDSTNVDHRYWQGWKLALKIAMEKPYEVAGRQSPVALRWDVEPTPEVAAPAEANEIAEETAPVRTLRRTTFPV